MVYDLLSIDNDIIEYDTTSENGELKKKKAVLCEGDELWEQFRFLHISEAMTGIADKFNEFLKSNPNAKLQRGQLGEMNLGKLSEVIDSIPQYNELLSNFNLHIDLIDKCQEEFIKKNLREIGELEQCLVTGVSEEGKSCSIKWLISNILEIITSGKLTDENRLRLLMIAAICIELNEKDWRMLTDTLDPSERRVIQNLGWLGTNPVKVGLKEKRSLRIQDDIKMAVKSGKLKNSSNNLRRRTAAVETIATPLTTAILTSTSSESLTFPPQSLAQPPLSRLIAFTPYANGNPVRASSRTTMRRLA
eukprot:TRINITY_DN5524_c0_g2_i6.p1 TRINITY_DN5524_c0_g2~~TRINITY_DN5524_c0_g2_i6.p1  ORF type:complete len:305 (+),score=41.56 TRINITY_DN5524_c0_g2_i6:885-1799(+)